MGSIKITNKMSGQTYNVTSKGLKAIQSNPLTKEKYFYPNVLPVASTPEAAKEATKAKQGKGDK